MTTREYLDRHRLLHARAVAAMLPPDGEPPRLGELAEVVAELLSAHMHAITALGIARGEL